MYLRQSTAGQEIVLGTFVDSTDGDTEETGLTIANTDIKLHKAGATTLASKNSGGATHIANGDYYAVLDATDTDTLGNLVVRVHVAGALVVKERFVVLPALVYDSLVVGGPAFPLWGIIDSGTAQAATGTTLQIAAASVAANDTLIGASAMAYGSTQAYWQTRSITDHDLATDTSTVDTWTVTPSGTINYIIFGGAPASATLPPAVNVTQWKGSTAPDMTGDAYARLGAPAGASIAADIAVIESQTDDIGAAGAGLTALASAADLTAVAGYLDTEIAAILADTNELQADWVNGGRLDLLIDAIKAKTDSLTFTVASTLDANITHAEGQSTVDGLAINVLLQRIHSYLWSKRSGLNGTDPDTVTIRNFADTGDVGTITFDAYGNNTAST